MTKTPPKKTAPASNTLSALVRTPSGARVLRLLHAVSESRRRVRIISRADMLKMTVQRVVNVFTRRRNFAVHPCPCDAAYCSVIWETSQPIVQCGGSGCRRTILTGILHTTTELLTKSFTRTTDDTEYVVGVATCGREECRRDVYDAMARTLPARGLP